MDCISCGKQECEFNNLDSASAFEAWPTDFSAPSHSSQSAVHHCPLAMQKTKCHAWRLPFNPPVKFPPYLLPSILWSTLCFLWAQRKYISFWNGAAFRHKTICLPPFSQQTLLYLPKQKVLFLVSPLPTAMKIFMLNMLLQPTPCSVCVCVCVK